MSYAVTRLIWPIPMSAVEKLVCARLANFAGDDGGSVFPSIGRVTDDCNLSRRSVQAAFRSLEKMGVLIKVREGSTGERRPAEYRFDLAALAKMARTEGRTSCTRADPDQTGSAAWVKMLAKPKT
jgi:hypothetical protein